MNMAKPDIDLLQARMADIKARVRHAADVVAFFRERPATAVPCFCFSAVLWVRKWTVESFEWP